MTRNRGKSRYTSPGAQALSALAAAVGDLGEALRITPPPPPLPPSPRVRFEPMPARSLGLEHIGCLIELQRSPDVADAVRAAEPSTAVRIGRLVGLNPGGYDATRKAYYRKLVLQYGDSQPHPVVVQLIDPVLIRIES